MMSVSIPFRYGTTTDFFCCYQYTILFFSQIQPFSLQKIRRPHFQENSR